MSSSEGKYNIKAVSKIVGIQPGTLRAWERRYHIVAPHRNEAGHRLYSDEHVRILKWLTRKVDEGFTISQAVSLYENRRFDKPSPEADRIDTAAELRGQLLNALLSFSEKKAVDRLNAAFSLFSAEKVVNDILAKLLVSVGDMWENGEITSAHEHYATSFILSRIGFILHNQPIDSHLPRVIAVCGPGEEHEIGLLTFTLYLKRKGFEAIYLGRSIAEEDFETIIRESGASFLFMSVTMADNLQPALAVLDELQAGFDGLQIGIGGAALTAAENALGPYRRNVVGNTEAEWDLWLQDKLTKKS
ncbi:MerR family transcriptional regulator [Bacillus marinisedimentorum]|uniref:MerR family transcriptional regulator n=1 Tax=Bacillus marinisedimentorum TaxID=1821260 RepID=UPI000872975D|nr:MerR family transcriptional regulator [Bacillus marinisedimentorum]